MVRGVFKVGVRDAWLGWAPEQQFRRLRLVANHCRFPVLAQGRVPNLASRVLALSVRRLSGDMQARFGHPVLLAEALALYCYSILRNPGFLDKVMKIRRLLKFGLFPPTPLHRARWA